MPTLKALAALATVVAVGSCARHANAQDLSGNFKALLPPGSADVDIAVEEAVVGRFAGFFAMGIQSYRHESGDVSDSRSDQGTLALTFDSFETHPLDRPTGLSGLVVVGNQKFPSRIRLKASPRGDGHRSFSVSLTGLSDSELVGVATIEPDRITMRLHDDSRHTTVVTLRQESRDTSPKQIFGTAIQSDAGISGVIYPDGQLP